MSGEDKAPTLRVGAKTHTGKVRHENQDRMGRFRFALGEVFIVADGMGGHRGGATAASLTVSGFEKHLTGVPAGTDPKKALQQATRLTNEEICAQASSGDAETSNMGSTVVLALVAGRRVLIAHVGDSRAYLFRNGTLKGLTRDHTVVQRLVEHGLLTEDQARNHPEASVLSRALGQAGECEGEVSEPLFIQPGDAILLCSDGLSGYLEDLAIATLINDHEEAQGATDALVDLALAAGGEDNITVQLLQFGPRSKTSAPIRVISAFAKEDVGAASGFAANGASVRQSEKDQVGASPATPPADAQKISPNIASTPRLPHKPGSEENLSQLERAESKPSDPGGKAAESPQSPQPRSGEVFATPSPDTNPAPVSQPHPIPTTALARPHRHLPLVAAISGFVVVAFLTGIWIGHRGDEKQVASSSQQGAKSVIETRPTAGVVTTVPTDSALTTIFPTQTTKQSSAALTPAGQDDAAIQDSEPPVNVVIVHLIEDRNIGGVEKTIRRYLPNAVIEPIFGNEDLKKVLRAGCVYHRAGHESEARNLSKALGYTIELWPSKLATRFPGRAIIVAPGPEKPAAKPSAQPRTNEEKT